MLWWRQDSVKMWTLQSLFSCCLASLRHIASISLSCICREPGDYWPLHLYALLLPYILLKWYHPLTPDNIQLCRNYPSWNVNQSPGCHYSIHYHQRLERHCWMDCSGLHIVNEFLGLDSLLAIVHIITVMVFTFIISPLISQTCLNMSFSNSSSGLSLSLSSSPSSHLPHLHNLPVGILCALSLLYFVLILSLFNTPPLWSPQNLSRLVKHFQLTVMAPLPLVLSLFFILSTIVLNSFLNVSLKLWKIWFHKCLLWLFTRPNTCGQHKSNAFTLCFLCFLHKIHPHSDTHAQ